MPLRLGMNSAWEDLFGEILRRLTGSRVKRSNSPGNPLMPKILQYLIASTLLLGVPLAQHHAEGAPTYRFTEIADTLGPLANLDEDPSINSNGTVTFRAFLDNGQQAILVGTGGPLTTIADSSGPLTGFGVAPMINANGTVAFAANVKAGGDGIFFGSGGSLSTVFLTAGFLGFPTINNSGTIAFVANNALLAYKSGSLTTMYDTSGLFSGFSAFVDTNNPGRVVFFAGLDSGGAGFFTGDGGSITQIATTTSGFTGFGQVASINNAGVVAFRGTPAGSVEGVFTSNGANITKLTDTSAGFLDFGGPSINDRGSVAFFADLPGGDSGIFAITGSLERIVGTGDPLLGSTVTRLGFFSPQGMNDRGQLAFLAVLADGRQAIVRADPVSSPESLLLLSAAVGLLSGFRFARTRSTDRRRAAERADPSHVGLRILGGIAGRRESNPAQ